MENEFKISLIVSFLLHVSLFLVFFVSARKAVSITLPVEIAYFSSPGPAGAASAPAPSVPLKAAPRLQKDDIPLPSKEKKKAAPQKKKTPPAPTVSARPSAAAASPAATPSENGDGTGAPGMGGSPLSLDTKNFPYSYYTTTIVRKIGRSWQWANEFGRLKAVIYFRIARDGSVSEVHIKDTSGDEMFDQQAMRAIRLASPFAPLPDGYPDENLGVYFEFAYR